ncbi:MAG TPA: hypothetical protein VH025_09825 [Solirubrobacteraceae bacterium]|jgi:hypothetical protein|nr:hypothetical protein [Solirubrobacteraceae bacterium]
MGPKLNTAFCLFAGFTALLVTILTAIKGVGAVTAVYALLAVGFLLRGTEDRWRRDR